MVVICKVSQHLDVVC